MTATFEISIPDLEGAVEALVDRAAAGETILLTRDGQPVAYIGPLPRYPDRGFGILDPEIEA